MLADPEDVGLGQRAGVVLRPRGVPRRIFPELLGPFWYDVQIFLWCAPCIVVVGMLLARRAAACERRRCTRCGCSATLYIDIVRGIPMILWITLLGFGVPGLLQTREWYGKFIIWGSVPSW